MNTKSKYRKISLIVLAVILTAFLAVGAWLSLFTEFTEKSFENSTGVETTAGTIDPQYFKERPYIVAETEELANAYAAKLNIPTGQFTFTSSSVLSIDGNGTWNGMASTTLMGKYAHLLLPNSVKKIASSRSNTVGITTVRWVSITADTGSQLAELAKGTSKADAVFGNGGGWLERVDFLNATQLRTLPAYIFYGCDRLYDLILPDTVTSIEEYAICASSMVHISLPEGLGADGSGLDVNAFNYYTEKAPIINICKIAEVELPSNANSTFEDKFKTMTSIKDSYLNIYKKGAGRSWLATTSDGFIFCKNISRTTPLSTEMGSSVTVEATKGQISYAINKWYLVGYRGVESGGDALLAKLDYMINYPKQVDLAKDGADRNGAYDYVDCTGSEIQNDFSDLASNTSALGTNVAINGDSRVIAGTVGNTKMRYDIGRLAFYFRWVWHSTIYDDTISAIGDYAFYNAPMTTFNCGDIKYIGKYGFRFFDGTQVDIIFYAPSPNPFCAADGFITATDSLNRVFVYRNYSDYSSRTNYSIGLYARMNTYTGKKKFYTYLVDVVPNVGEWDADANAYKYTEVKEEKIQRLYAGTLSGYNKDLYDNPYCFERQSDDTWGYVAQTFPALTEYTGYSKTSWFTSDAFTTKYTETSIGTADTSSATVSLRNAANKGIDTINMYAKKIVSVNLTDKVREYKNTSFSESDPIITGIPESISGDYTVSVTSYVDSSGVAKSYESIGSTIQEAGVYTIQIQPHANYGEWSVDDVPTMTVTVNKTEIDLGDYTIFRLGVTNGIDNVNLRPGKEVSGEQAVTLYKYNDSWYTDKQDYAALGNWTSEREGLWNSFVRAEGDGMAFSLTLATNVIKDAHDSNTGIFTCSFPGTQRSQSGEYTDQVVVELTDKAKNNYEFVGTNDESRQFVVSTEKKQTVAKINKTWYIVKLNNWLTYNGESGNDARSYNMKSEWEFGSNDLPTAPAVALGTYVIIKFGLELKSPNNELGIIRINDVDISEFDKYFNTSMPVGEYRVVFAVNFEGDDYTKYGPFQQSFSFNIYEKDFTDDELAAINQIKGAAFEYDMNQVTNTYLTNGVLFDLSAFTDATKKTKLQDMLALGRTPQWNTARVGAWAEKTYDSLFESNFKITYNLNRMWNNSYLDLYDLLDDYPLNTPDVYTIYYQLTCKNRKSLISPNNNNRRLCSFEIIVYRTLTVPQGIEDIEYTGYEIYPEINYLNGELDFERAYYEASFPSNQDNVNHGDKKVILTINPSNTQLYRWEKDASKNVAEKSYKIVPANNSTTVPLYMAGWAWNSEITLDNIIWATQFGDAQDYSYTLVPVKTDNDDREALTDITKFGMATAGDYNLVAYCPADVNGNWKEYEQSISIRVHQAGNSWVKSPSISTWTWNQYENFDWDADGAVSPIEIHAIPTYYASPKETGQPADGWAGTGRFDFRIYSIDSTKTGNDMYNVVRFDDGDFHFQYATDSEGNFVKNGDHFVLPINVAKKLASLPAGRYYLVATVYGHNNYTGLNNSSESFVQGAVPFTIASANNVWTHTITANDWEYSEFRMGYHLNAATAKYDTELTYSVCTGNTTEAAVVNGIKLENIKSISDIAPGSTYTYAQLINMLNVGEYTLRVHGDQAQVNEREGINYLAIDDQREFRVTKAANTLNQTFAVFNYTIGTPTAGLMTKYTARFESEKVGYRISQGGSYVDGLSSAATTDEPIKIAKSLTYDEFLTAIASLKSTESGSNYTVWWTTSDGTNFEARSGQEVITIYLGQNGWLNDKIPTIEDWEYDGTQHEFDKSIVQLKHSVDSSKIATQYYVANLNEYTGQYERGAALDGCPINVGNYLVAINVPNDDYYKGLSTDLFFRVTMASNKFKTMPAIKNGGWIYSQLATGDIVIGAPEHEEDNMMLTYVIYRNMGSSNPEERVATLQWELGDGFNNNEVVLEAFYARLNNFDVGNYKLYATLSASTNYKEVVLDAVSFTITKANNAWKEDKAPTIASGTSWEWDNYQDSTWNDVETKFGNVNIYVNNNAVATLSISRYLSELGVGNYTMRFEVAGTDNYNSFTDSLTFSVTKNSNGWLDGEEDTTAFVHNWTWGEYNNDIAGNNPTWVEPAPKYGTPYASIYKGTYEGNDGEIGTPIRANVALYSLDILLNYLDAGDYYVIWNIASDTNYEALERQPINFKIEVNPNAWDKNKPASMHENDRDDGYGWTKGEYGKDANVEYFTVPSAKYGLVVAKIIKYDSLGNESEVIVDGISNNVSISNTLDRLSAGKYKLFWSAIDPDSTGNFKEIAYPTVMEFTVNRGTVSWTGEAPFIDGWQWGAFKSSLWKAPGIQAANPVATVVVINDDKTDGEHVIEKVSSDLLSPLLERLEVGNYRLIWTAEDNDDFEIQGEAPDDLVFQVSQNRNGWAIAPAITAKDHLWQWGLFSLGYWTMPSPRYHDNDQYAIVYKVNGDYDYDPLTNKYNMDKCVEMKGITLDTIDKINELSVGKYLIKVCVPEDARGRYMGLESVVPFEIVPNENNFTSDSCYVNGYAYLEFRGYWRAPVAKFGEIRASIYRMENGVRVEKVDEVSTFDLSDALRELHTGDYQLDWTIAEDEMGNYLSHTRTSEFSVAKANNRWLSRPTIKDWAYGLYNSSITPTAMPLAVGDEEVYFKIVNALYGEVADFRAYAEKFEKDANGNYYDENGRLILTADGYFTDSLMVEKVMSDLQPGIYHLLAYYPEMADYNRLDTNNDHLFEVRYIENKWKELPSIKSWIAGSTVSKPKGEAVHGDVTWTYYKAVYDTELGKYVIDGDAIATDGDNPPEQVGKYILVASTELVEGYAPLREEIFFEIFEKSITGVSGNLLLWIDISLATIASITAAVIIYTLLKARSRKDDDVFNG